ncbi:unnamed protein product [Moneuplotes crassus]|uniref:Uncharacterized protein n=1 Tax=Euplotes crassus TaxID=5936 RepID=A0AAD1XDL3_EUPCR|nr:unnamed protein product [Moneuplotes crassus]
MNTNCLKKNKQPKTSWPLKNLLFHNIKPKLAIRKKNEGTEAQKMPSQILESKIGETIRTKIKESKKHNINIQQREKVEFRANRSKMEKINRLMRANSIENDQNSYLFEDLEVKNLFLRVKEKLKFSKYNNGQFFSPQKLYEKLLEINCRVRQRSRCKAILDRAETRLPIISKNLLPTNCNY